MCLEATTWLRHDAVSKPCQSIWNSWWTKWHWVGFFFYRRDQLVDRKKVPFIYIKQITQLPSGNQTYTDLRNRTVELRHQVQPTVVITQRSQSKILIAIANATRYVTNHTLHKDFNIPYVSDVIRERINKHHIKLKAHPNPLLQPLLQPVNNRRLKRWWPLDLKGTWGDIAGWTPYHDIVIYHHISL
jgi:hypothetical protein